MQPGDEGRFGQLAARVSLVALTYRSLRYFAKCTGSSRCASTSAKRLCNELRSKRMPLVGGGQCILLLRRTPEVDSVWN